MKKLLFLLGLGLTMVIMACSGHDAPDGDYGDDELNQGEVVEGDIDNSDYNLLFIGNSLTYTNNLPRMVRTYAQSKDLTISVTSITRANYALIDHWNDRIIQERIKSGKYDYVIVQQGPSSQTAGRELLLDYGGRISALCKEYNSELAYYMVWPSRTYYHTFDGVIESYTMAAEATNDILCPVGKVWKTHFDNSNDFSYYGNDGFHPSVQGSTVAARIIYDSLFKD